jgi:hypothetical protein
MRRAILAEEHSDEMRRCEPPDDTFSGERQEALARGGAPWDLLPWCGVAVSDPAGQSGHRESHPDFERGALWFYS